MEECELVVKEGWGRRFGGSKVDQMIKKLNCYKKLLKEWSRKVVPHNKKLIAELMLKVGEKQNNDA